MWLKNKIISTTIQIVRRPFLNEFFLKITLGLTRFMGIGVFEILEIKYGHAKSHRLWQSINANEEPMPWMTYPVVEYLNQLDFRDKRIFEYGSGNSSLYWQKRAKNVVSIEDNLEWYNRLKLIDRDNHKLIFASDTEGYIQSIAKENGLFDVIIVDGSERMACAKIAVEYLAPNGMLIFDNSDWYPNTCAFLRTMDLIQIDFHGFGPINQYTWTSSLFIKRSFDFQLAQSMQPMRAIGSIENKND